MLTLYTTAKLVQAYTPNNSISSASTSILLLRVMIPSTVVFIDNTPMFVKIAEGLGMQGILHKDLKSTSAKLASIGFQTDVGVSL